MKMNRFFKFRRDAKFCVSTALLLLLLCFQPLAFADLNTGLVAYYSFDDCTAKDNSGNGHDGTIRNNVTCTNGVISKSLHLQGQDHVGDIGGHILIPAIDFNNMPNYSLCLWVNEEKMSDEPTYNHGEGYIYFGDNNGSVGISHFVDNIYFGNGQYGASIPFQSTDRNKFVHYCLSHANGELKAYKNSLFVSSIQQQTFVSNSNSALGRHWWNAGTETSTRFIGSLDEVRIYNRALTAAEVTALYQQGTTPDSNDVLGNFLDLNNSSIDYANNQIKLKFTVPASQLGNYFNQDIRLKETGTIWNIADVKTQLQTQNPVILSFPDGVFLKNSRDKLTSLQFRSEPPPFPALPNPQIKATLQSVYDNLPNLAGNAILNSRTVAETKPTNNIVCNNKQGIKSVCNNFFDSAETGTNTAKTAVFRNTLTHRLIDFDKFVSVSSPIWANTKYGKTPIGDSVTNNRIPLLLIHGWQGGKGLRNPAQLGLSTNSEWQYWRHFLDYYLATPALQSRYHVYLYHYPTYKHVTYNASVLTEMLTELATKAPNSDLNVAMQSGKKGVVVLAHSMGGLVTRSAIEEYQAFGANGEKLRRLITLDTPHHGSPGANPGFAGNAAGKDLYSQGSADLQWDNFNLLYDKAAVDAQNLVRWNLTKIKSINSKKFDDAYQIACNTTSCANIVTQNPWLEWMNFTFDKATFSKKYLLYAGWIMNSPVSIIDNGWMNVSNVSLGLSAGIPSGGAEPVNSALWYIGSSPYPFILDSLNESPFYALEKPLMTSCYKKANWDASQWFGGDSSALKIREDVCGNSVLISKSATLSTPNPNHPLGFQMRIFWDYDHETMVNGAYWGAGILGKQAGGWDKYINKDSTLTTGSSSSDTGFRPDLEKDVYGNLIRDVYIAKAQGYLFNSESNTFPLNNPSTYNPLKLEPLFMVLHKDLLRTNTEAFIVP
jgi:pimeloyl-ACP methyl ester carboxylesterase